MMWVELISPRPKGDNGDKNTASSLIQTANQKASFYHMTEKY